MSVRIDGIHPASRIGKMILKRSKRSRLRFVIVSPKTYACRLRKLAHHRYSARHFRQAGMSRAKGEVEIMVQSNHTRKSSSVGQSKRLPDRSPSQLRKSRGDCCVSIECGDDFRAKRTIFEL